MTADKVNTNRMNVFRVLDIQQNDVAHDDIDIDGFYLMLKAER